MLKILLFLSICLTISCRQNEAQDKKSATFSDSVVLNSHIQSNDAIIYENPTDQSKIVGKLPFKSLVVIYGSYQNDRFPNSTKWALISSSLINPQTFQEYRGWVRYDQLDSSIGIVNISRLVIDSQSGKIVGVLKLSGKKKQALNIRIFKTNSLDYSYFIWNSRSKMFNYHDCPGLYLIYKEKYIKGPIFGLDDVLAHDLAISENKKYLIVTEYIDFPPNYVRVFNIKSGLIEWEGEGVYNLSNLDYITGYIDYSDFLKSDYKRNVPVRVGSKLLKLLKEKSVVEKEFRTDLSLRLFVILRMYLDTLDIKVSDASWFLQGKPLSLK